ncbi:proton-conducting transporter membrane subunit [Clostridiisalibacter paucivorans]|uniref:proton-conducting transporter transmembrane domain-containing protein n=1 Tax=Clostridiisalibacter paucivorans TaxID=408753 RepID=UPI00047D2A86|nr:proton-conducting transporter membrane subunit [Clostridiisalibacter paucivorans]
MTDYIILIPVLFPVLAAIFMVTISPKRENARNIFVISSVIINLILLTAVLYVKGETQIHIFKFNSFLDIYFKIDKLGIMFSTLASILWVFTTFYSSKYMEHEGKEKQFFIFFTITLAITIGIAFAGNLITLYIFYEFLTLATFPMVIHAGSKEALDSGKKYLIYSFGGATLVIFGMILLFYIANDLSFIPQGILNNISSNEYSLLLIVFISLFLGFGVKAALVPFHSWLPAAMVAPTPVSSLLHAVAVVKSGIFALIRVTYFIFGVDIIQKIDGDIYILILVIITILMGSLLALHQDNLKKRLAYSTISQLGYILLGILLLNENGLVGGLLHLINHAVIKITLFFCAGAIYFKTGKKSIKEIKGIGREMPITMICFSIASISLVGIPPTNGFVSKWYLALGGLNANRVMFPVILLLSAFLTAAYLVPIVVTAFFSGSDPDIQYENKDPNIKMLGPIVALTFIVIILGLFPNAVLHYIQDIARALI